MTYEEAELKMLFKYSTLRKGTVEELVKYWYKHRKPNSIFLIAALTNDLRATMLLMNTKDLSEMRDIVTFIAVDLPKESNGTENIVQEWLDVRKMPKND